MKNHNYEKENKCSYTVKEYTLTLCGYSLQTGFLFTILTSSNYMAKFYL